MWKISEKYAGRKAAGEAMLHKRHCIHMVFPAMMKHMRQAT
jgi:hypothetical protein